MTRFTVRVELHDETDYTLLHEKMEAEGLSRSIMDTDKRTWYQLPRAEYSYISEEEITREDIMSKTKAAVRSLFADVHPEWSQKKVDQHFEILVTPAGGRLWFNLPPADS